MTRQTFEMDSIYFVILIRGPKFVMGDYLYSLFGRRKKRQNV